MSLITALCLLLLASLISDSSLNQAKNESYYLKHFQKNQLSKVDRFDEIEKHKFDDFVEPKIQESVEVHIDNASIKEETQNKHPKIFKTSKLSLKALLTHPPHEKEYQAIFVKLITKLYSNAPFYTDDLPQKLLQALKEKCSCYSKDKNKIHLKSVFDLAKIEVEDPKLQAAIYYMLKGHHIEGAIGGYYSLFDFVSLPNRISTHINLIGAPNELLAAIFDERVSEKIIEKKPVWRETLKKHKNNTQIALDLLTKFYNEEGIDASKYQNLTCLRYLSK